MLLLKDGIHENVTNPTYHSMSRVSNSDLTLFKISPYDYYAWKLAEGRPGREPTKAMALGTALHMAVLEPDLFGSSYVRAPQIDRRTKKWKDFVDSVVGMEILSEDDFASIEAMSKEIRNIPFVAEVLAKAQREVTVLWTDEQTGLPCRARPDLLSVPSRIVFDIKTTAGLSYHAFSKSAINYNYYRQCFWYTSGLNKILALQPEDGFDFCIVAVESCYPFKAAMFDFDPELLAIAEAAMRLELEALKDCLATGVWPTALEGLNTIRAPEWMKKNLQKDFSFLTGDAEK